MMSLRIIFALLALFGSTATAAEIPVRSGAHATFTRLVLDAPLGVEWTIEQQAANARVTIIGHSDGFDISNVFERIDRSVIGAIDADTDTVEITFACDCQASAFRSGQRMIVIDVSETDPQTRQRPAEVAEAGLEFVGLTRLRFPIGAPTETAEDLSPAINEPRPSVPDLSAPLPALRPTIEAAPGRAQPTPSDATELESLQNAQRKLAERIGLAATTGILRSSRQRPNPMETETRPQLDTSIFEQFLITPENNSQLDPSGGNVRISSSSDLPLVTGRSDLESTMQGVQCLDPSKVRIQDWGEQAMFSTSIGELRRNLFSERDTLNGDAVLALTQHYLYFGFGAEALKTLSMAPDLAAEYPQLIDLAHVMEHRSAGLDSYLRRFAGCGSEVALWAILADDTIGPNAEIDSDAALRALSGLPPHLRLFLAPLLSERLLAYGDPDAATLALRGVERTPEPLTAAAQLARANIELEQGEVADAQNRLRTVVSSNEEQSAEALIRYVDTHFDADVDIGQDIATLVEAYATEMRDDPLGPELRRAHVLALGKSGQFAEAFETLHRMRPIEGANKGSEIRSALVMVLTKDADDATFLRHAFDAIADRPEGMSMPTRTELVKRLIQLGFYSEAELIMSAQQDFPVTADYRTLRARLSLGLNRPREALALLGTLSHDEANMLRAQARLDLGEYEQAYAMYAALDDTTERARVAWLSDEWKQLLEESDPVFGPVVEMAQSDLRQSNNIDGMLQRTQDTLKESAQARAVVQELLSIEVGISESTN